MDNQPKMSLPTENVELPSKGLLYPLDNPLSSGIVEMKYMTAKEEDILSNQNFIKNGTVFDKLLKSLIVTNINYDDLTIGDKNAILIAARILGYGKDFQIKYPHPVTGEEELVTIDLAEIKNKEVDKEVDKIISTPPPLELNKQNIFPKFGIIFSYGGIKIANLHLVGGKYFDQLITVVDKFDAMLIFKLELLTKIIDDQFNEKYAEIETVNANK